jgi:peptidoglycan/xylan/chitin deacetylase (PgdA/CDA1 family)
VRRGTPTVCLTFDFDALSVWLGTLGLRGPSALSRGEFGARVGIYRILELLDRESVPATFFVPGHTIDAYPDACREIHARGHEIAHHGYLHERPVDLSPPQERRVLERGIDVIEQLTGSPPVGYRAPGWELSDHTVELLLEHGFEYESSMMADDFRPYWCRRGDIAAEDGPFVFGPEVPLAELPVSWSLDDLPQMEFMRPPAAPVPGLSAYDKTLGMWTTDFDYMVERVEGGIFTTTMHPEVIGRGGRMRVLEGLLAHLKRAQGVEFVRAREAIRAWTAHHPAPVYEAASR